MNYLHIIMFVLAIAFFYSSNQKKHQKVPYFVICVWILYCSCLRTVSYVYDTHIYVEFFQMTSSMSLKRCLEWNSFEPGYVLLNKLISTYTNNTQVFLSIISIFILVPIFILIWRKSENPLLSLLIFVAIGNLHSTFAALRQWCAVAVLTFGYDFMVKRKMVPFLITVAAAYFFHQTAIFVLPLYFLYPIKMNRMTIFFCLAASMCCIIFRDRIMSLLNMFARLETEEKSGSGYVQLVTFWALVFVIEIMAYPIENKIETKLGYMALLYSAIIQPLCLKYGPFARIHLYCWYGIAFSIPGLMKYMSRNYDRKNSYILKFTVMLIMALWYITTSDGKTLSLIIG